jgi:hypothetical protein
MTQVTPIPKPSRPVRRKGKPAKGNGGVKSRRRVAKKPSRTAQRNRCDALCSKIVRLRDRVCTRCGSPDFLQWSHHLSRRFLVIRYDFDNAVAHCRSCHTYFTHNPDLHALWIIERIGMAKYLELHERREQGTKDRYRPDYPAIEKELKLVLAGMESVFPERPGRCTKTDKRKTSAHPKTATGVSE